jgi:hypothetical protein
MVSKARIIIFQLPLKNHSLKDFRRRALFLSGSFPKSELFWYKNLPIDIFPGPDEHGKLSQNLGFLVWEFSQKHSFLLQKSPKNQLTFKELKAF